MTTIRYFRYLLSGISKPVKLLLPALLLCMLPVLAGCANTDNPAASGSPAAAPSTSEAGAGTGAKGGAHKLTIMLDWYPNAVHSFCMRQRLKAISLRKVWRLRFRCRPIPMMR